MDSDPELTLLAGGKRDDSVGYFVEPTVLVSDNPAHQVFSTEYFGPILAVHVYPDTEYERILEGANDKAGSMFNLLRWASPRSIKETFDAPTDIGYPNMG